MKQQTLSLVWRLWLPFFSLHSFLHSVHYEFPFFFLLFFWNFICQLILPIDMAQPLNSVQFRLFFKSHAVFHSLPFVVRRILDGNARLLQQAYRLPTLPPLPPLNTRILYPKIPRCRSEKKNIEKKKKNEKTGHFGGDMQFAQHTLSQTALQ